MATTFVKHARPLSPVNQKDWEALEDIFKNLDPEPIEQLEAMSAHDAEALTLLVPSEEVGCPA